METNYWNTSQDILDDFDLLSDFYDPSAEEKWKIMNLPRSSRGRGTRVRDSDTDDDDEDFELSLDYSQGDLKQIDSNREYEVQDALRKACGAGYSNRMIEDHWRIETKTLNESKKQDQFNSQSVQNHENKGTNMPEASINKDHSPNSQAGIFLNKKVQNSNKLPEVSKENLEIIDWRSEEPSTSWRVNNGVDHVQNGINWRSKRITASSKLPKNNINQFKNWRLEEPELKRNGMSRRTTYVHTPNSETKDNQHLPVQQQFSQLNSEKNGTGADSNCVVGDETRVNNNESGSQVHESNGFWGYCSDSSDENIILESFDIEEIDSNLENNCLDDKGDKRKGNRTKYKPIDVDIKLPLHSSALIHNEHNQIPSEGTISFSKPLQSTLNPNADVFYSSFSVNFDNGYQLKSKDFPPLS